MFSSLGLGAGVDYGGRMAVSVRWVSCLILATVLGRAEEGPSFNRDIRPLLSDRCFHCHGPDEASRKGKLRLDVRAEAVASAIVPGQAGESELMERLLAADPDDRMPPPDSGTKALSADEIELLRSWIDAGAVYQKHWSFEPIRRPNLPAVAQESWVRNPIDSFVLARLEAEGIAPAPEAAPRMLQRRVAFDLTGLPPRLEDLVASDEAWSSRRYAAYVNQLLASKRYGERMAMVWLDAARYADTDGFQADATRSNWAWRDWVIEAYNRNLPFDQFTLEQFAGDLLPDASAEQVLATCFHRNHMANGEGGREPEESRIDYVIDRVNTMGTVWLGLTLGCAQCHNHKFDPISQAEYYQLNAFFNSVDEDGKAGGGAKPFLDYQSPFAAQGLREAELWLATRERALASATQAAQDRFRSWLEERVQERESSDLGSAWEALVARDVTSSSESEIGQDASGDFVVEGINPRHDDYLVLARPEVSRITGVRLTVLPREEGLGYSEAEDGHVVLTNVKFSIRATESTQVREIAVASAVADYENQKKSKRDYGLFRDVLDDDPRTGWTTNGSAAGESRVGVFGFAEPVTLAANEALVVELRHRSLKGFSSIRRFRLSVTDERGPAVSEVGPTPLEQLSGVVRAAQSVDEALRERLWRTFREDDEAFQTAQGSVAAAKRRADRYRSAVKPQKVMVLKPRETQRETHVLVRGVWDQKGPAVARALPKALAQEDQAAPTRVELARWLVDRNNPLTARVTVNRYWQMYFGHGLVRTPEDFGMQGEPPTHPVLLDWLAAEFMESGWDVKHLQRLIVSSATYRQTSDASAAAVQRDPDNRLLARATRFRLPSWMIRDAALEVSGLAVHRLGGPPVYPHQPPGLWADSTMGRFHYEPSVGGDLYRRSVYGFWRRSVGPALMFDASKRRVCQVRITRTSTPLHALTLMNDLTFLEAGCHLAKTSAGDSPQVRMEHMAERVLGRSLGSDDLASLREQFESARGYYREHPDAAAELLALEPSVTSANLANPGVEAALALVGMTLLNLDEAMTRQ